MSPEPAEHRVMAQIGYQMMELQSVTQRAASLLKEEKTSSSDTSEQMCEVLRTFFLLFEGIIRMEKENKTISTNNTIMQNIIIREEIEN